MFDDIPDWIDREAWYGFVEMRAAMRKVPFTDRAARMIIRDLLEIKSAGYCPNEALDQSTLMGWRGVWPAKDKSITRKLSAQVDSTQAYLRQQAEHASKASPMPDNLRKLIRRSA